MTKREMDGWRNVTWVERPGVRRVRWAGTVLTAVEVWSRAGMY